MTARPGRSSCQTPKSCRDNLSTASSTAEFFAVQNKILRISHALIFSLVFGRKNGNKF